MTARKEYSTEESRIIAQAYTLLAIHQFEGTRVNKAQLYRDTAPLLNGRTRGAFEAKLMNCSAIAVARGLLPMLPGGYVKGYKPAPNAAKALGDILADAINASNLNQQKRAA